MLDLDGTPPPVRPHTRGVVLTVRVHPELAAWVHDTATIHRTNTAHVMRQALEQARDGGRWPPDVQRWLAAQAACLGTPGDPEGALVQVVRHLATRWPNGSRLNP